MCMTCCVRALCMQLAVHTSCALWPMRVAHAFNLLCLHVRPMRTTTVHAPSACGYVYSPCVAPCTNLSATILAFLMPQTLHYLVPLLSFPHGCKVFTYKALSCFSVRVRVRVLTNPPPPEGVYALINLSYFPILGCSSHVPNSS